MTTSPPMKKMRSPIRAAAVSLSLLVALANCNGETQADEPAAAQASDPALVGDWLLLQINRGGEDIDLDHLEGAVRQIGATAYSIEPMSGTTIRGDYTVDTATDPRSMDEFVANGRFEGGTLKGIYQVVGDRLTISFGAPGEARPTKLVSEPGTQFTVAVHKRVE